MEILYIYINIYIFIYIFIYKQDKTKNGDTVT